MQRLRNTFQRSRTPTGADMKMQSSLDVPKTVRSASFDEIQLEAQRTEGTGRGAAGRGAVRGRGAAGGDGVPGGGGDSGPLLRVPLVGGQRSKSFDGAAGGGCSSGGSSGSVSSGGPAGGGSASEEGSAYLEVPARSRFQRRRSSGERMPACIHCALMEEWKREPVPAAPSPGPLSSPEVSDDDDDDEDDSDEEEEDVWPEPSLEDVVVPACGIRVTLSASPASPEEKPPTPPPASPVRRRSIQRQEALFYVEPPTNSSLETTVSDLTSDGSDVAMLDVDVAVDLAEAPVAPVAPLLVRDFYLAVPELKRDRAASVDSCFINKTAGGGKAEEVVQVPGSTLEPPPLGSGALRSRSVDIVLPTDEQARYKALAMAAPPSQQLTITAR